MVSVGNLVTANTEYRIFNIDGEVTEVYDDGSFKLRFETGEEEVHFDLDIVSNLDDLGVDNAPEDIPNDPDYEGPIPDTTNLGGVLNKIYVHP